jgi:hypothetical protein
MIPPSFLSSHLYVAQFSLCIDTDDFPPAMPQLNACDARAGSRWESARDVLQRIDQFAGRCNDQRAEILNMQI